MNPILAATVIVYRSKSEQYADEFWMSEAGLTVQTYLLAGFALFFLGVVVAIIYGWVGQLRRR